MPRARRKPPAVMIMTATTLSVVGCGTCVAPATVTISIGDLHQLSLCDGCYRAWRASTPGDEGERLTELRG